MNALAYHGNQSRDTVPRFELKEVVSAYEPLPPRLGLARSRLR